MTCKCAGCGCEISIEERRELISKLERELYEIVYAYDTQMPILAIAECFMQVSKDLICSKKLDYVLTLGLLVDMVTDGLSGLLQSHLEEKDDKESKEKGEE